MWTLRNLLLALKIRSLIHKWIVKSWWQQCLENGFATHPGVVLICFWLGKCCNWFHWRKRSGLVLLVSEILNGVYRMLAHERQESAQVTCLGASFRYQCKRTAVWLLSSSQSQILVLHATEYTRRPWQYDFFPNSKYRIFLLGQILLIKWLTRV